MAKPNKQVVALSSINTRVRFEQWANNPECAANTMSAVLNVPMAAVAQSLGYQGNKGTSPFAVVRGMTFEHDLFKDEAQRLRDGLERAEVLPEGTVGFEDFRLPRNRGSKVKSLDEAISGSREFLHSLPKNSLVSVPSITTGLTLRLAKGQMLPEATLILDVMTIHPQEDGKFVLRVGEIKVFPDRGGYTDPQHLASARAQAGVYKEALENWIELEGLGESLSVSHLGFLVFTWPGSGWPVIRGNEDLREQADRARRGFKQFDDSASDLVGVNSAEYEPSEYAEWVAHSETKYKEACWGFCDLAPRCQDLALRQDRGIVLGTEAAKLLGTTSMTRALELLDGALPETEFEESLKSQLRNADWGDE